MASSPLLLMLLLTPLSVLAQSTLPSCPDNVPKRNWHGCYGADVWANGSKYIGEFNSGKYHGVGTLIHYTGDKYVGEFKNDTYFGEGIRYTSIGAVDASGRWANNSLVQPYLIDQRRYPFVYRPQEEKDRKAPQQAAPMIITDVWPNGTKYVGEVIAGKYNGRGELTLYTGEKYVGKFRDDTYHGEGIRYSANGSVVASGYWGGGTLVNSYPLDKREFPFNSNASVSPETQASQSNAPSPINIERDRLAAEIEVERRRRQELEQLLAESQRSSLQSQPSTTNLSIKRLNAHALVIGNSSYPGALRLANPVNDSRAMSAKLRSLGFSVTEVSDANRAKLVNALSQFNRTASGADLTLLFYSGHGVQILGTNYILPIDIDQTDVAQATIQGISINSVVEQFMPGPTKIVFLDACRNNPLAASNNRALGRGLAPINVSQGTLISYATKDGQTALDGLPGQSLSPFTSALLEHIGDPEDIAVVLRKVRDKVVRATGGKQQPWEYGSLSGGALVLSTARK